MTVGLITNFPDYVGLGKYALELFKELKKKADVTLVACNDDGRTKGEVTIDGVNFPVLRKTLNAYMVYPKKIPDFQLYHASNQFLARVADFKKQTVVTVTDLFFVKSSRNAPWISRLIMKKVFQSIKNADRVIAISENTKKDLTEMFGVDEEKIRLVHLGIDTKRYKRQDKKKARKKLGLPLDKKIVFNIGSETDLRKNAANVFKSFYEAQKEYPNLFLVKLGKRDESITQLVKSLGIESKVLRMERAEEKDMPLLYSAADVYLNLDIETGFGLPPFESMSCGTPIICSSTGEFSELIGRSGLGADPLNPSEIKNELLLLLNDEKLRKKLISNGLKASKDFTWKKAAEQTLKVYREIIDV